MLYSIKQFAALFNTSEHTIRYYTDIGLLPCKRDKNGRRIFDEESLNWMQGITCLKQSGASIDTIKEYCKLCKMPSTKENLYSRYQIILKQQQQAYEKIKEAKATAKYMDEKIKHYQDVMAGKIPDDTNPENWSEENRPKPHKKITENH